MDENTAKSHEMESAPDKINRRHVIAILHRFKESRAKEYEITRLGLFGSLARGADNEKSDIDIVVELSRPDFFTLIGIKQELEEE